MKLFYAKGACSLGVRIVITEMGINCEFESVNLQTKKTETGQDYLKINDKGSVSALQLDDGQILTENLVIMQYLVDHFKNSQLCPPVNDFKRYKVLEWLNFMSTEVHKTLGALFNPAIVGEYREKIIMPLIKKRFDYLNSHLEGKDFLYDNHFTLPDAYLFVMLLWTFHFKINLQDWPNLEQYFNHLSQHPSVVKALKAEGIELK